MRMEEQRQEKTALISRAPVGFTFCEDAQGRTYHGARQRAADLKEGQMKPMCHGMGAFVSIGSGEEAKMEEGRGVDHRFELRVETVCVEKTKRERVFSR